MKRLPLVLLAVLTIGTAMALAEAEEPKVDIDFSCVGVGAGKPMLIVGPLVWRVRPSGGDDTALIQAALDDVASRLMGADGLRGTVVLEEGTFRVEGQLRVKADGVALIGCNDRTIVLATGLDRRALIWLGGDEAPKVSTEIAVTDETVRAGSTVLTIADVGGFTVGDRVVVRRPSTAEWIADLGMDKWPGSFASIRLNWLPGSMDLRWDRSITAIDSTTNSLMLDAPITTALDARYGGGFVAKVIGGEPVTGVALGNLVLDSEYDTANPKDEEHAWIAVQVDNAEDVEVSAITVRHFVSSAVRVGPRARRVSVGACASEMPVAEVGGYRRQSFVVEGQQVYVWACRADLPWNAFSVGQLGVWRGVQTHQGHSTRSFAKRPRRAGWWLDGGERRCTLLGRSCETRRPRDGSGYSGVARPREREGAGARFARIAQPILHEGGDRVGGIRCS